MTLEPPTLSDALTVHDVPGVLKTLPPVAHDGSCGALGWLRTLLPPR